MGRSRLSSNLNQLAYAVNIGSLPVTPETEAELLAALRDVQGARPPKSPMVHTESDLAQHRYLDI